MRERKGAQAHFLQPLSAVLFWVTTMSDGPDDLHRLNVRVDALEERLRVLEDIRLEAVTPAAQEASTPSPAYPAQEHPIERLSTAFAVFGRAMLGIAGAYALRALAASGTVPKLGVAAVAMVYAIAWLVGASRVDAARRFAGGLYAGTSALILAPMLWELTLRFNVLSPALAAGVLALFVAAATVLTRQEENSPIFTVAYAAGAATALALSIGTHSMTAFIVLLLTMLAVCEVWYKRAGSLRVIVAVTTDLAIWILIFLYRGPASARADYQELSTAALLLPALVLFSMQAVSIARRSELLRKKLAAFDVLQIMIAFLLAACSLLFFAPGTGAAMVSVALFVLAAACYAGAFLLLRRKGEARNFHVLAVWAMGLLLTGLFWLLPTAGVAVLLGIVALACIIVGTRIGSMSFEFHGVIYLAVAAAACGLMDYTLQALAGEMPRHAPWIVLFISTCALLCYAAGRERAGEAWPQQTLHFVPAWITVCSAAALLARGFVGLAALVVTPDLHHVAFLRTLTVCLIALALALGGSLCQRLEMTRIAYVALAFVAAKLVFEDLRLGRMEFIAASIFLFALTLIGVPRLARWGQKRQRPASAR
jgi:hypothetical protein